MFFWNSLVFSMIQQMLAIWSLVPLPLLNPGTSESSWFMYCWSLVWRILSITLLACEMSKTVWQSEHSLALSFSGIGMKIDLFQSSGYCWVFQICWHIDGWMASLTRWTWVWVDSGSWWWTRRSGMLRFMGLQRVGHNWVTELNCVQDFNSIIF